MVDVSRSSVTVLLRACTPRTKDCQVGHSKSCFLHVDVPGDIRLKIPEIIAYTIDIRK